MPPKGRTSLLAAYFFLVLLLSLYCKEQAAPASVLPPALLLCDKSCADQIVDPPLHRPARELQFPRYGADGRITLSFLVASVFQVHIDRFCTVRLLAIPSAIQASASFKSCLSTHRENLGLFRICPIRLSPPCPLFKPPQTLPSVSAVFPHKPPVFQYPSLSGWHLLFPHGFAGRCEPSEGLFQSHPPFNLHTIRPCHFPP